MDFVHLPHSTCINRWPVLVLQICPTNLRNMSRLQHLLILAGQQICWTYFVKKHFSCRRRSDVLRFCSMQTRVVHNSTQPSVVDEQESELVQSSVRYNVVQIAPFPSERARCTQVLDNVPDTCFRTDSSLSLSLSRFDVLRLHAQTTQPSLPSAKLLPPSPVLLPLFCVVPGSDPCSPIQLDSTVWSRTQTSLSFVAEVGFEIHMRHMPTPLLVCRPIVVLRHASTCPQVFCWSSDLSCSGVCATLRPLV